MPHITAYYKMYLPGGHHRQPRNANAELTLAPASGGDTPFTPPYFPVLPYTLGGGNGLAKLLFWSDTDGTTGVIHPPQPLDIPSAATARTVTAWYYPTGGGNGNGSSIIDDAFSAAKGGFIDDTFVDVTSHPALTANANVIGIVPTTSAETLVAKGTVASTTEPFSQWIFNDTLMPVGDATLNVSKGADGIAIAIYQKGEFPRARVPYFEEFVRIFFGVINDGPGLTDHGPIGPWDPFLRQLVRSGVVAARSAGLDQKIAQQIVRLAAKDAIAAMQMALPEFEKLAAGKGR
ncbi:MAG: hypothetical protein HOP91_00560 [Sphingomonas sp.]|nr:hypothetical protein [Sphingomonas sp.]